MSDGPAHVELRVNGSIYSLAIEPRVSLLDALRDHMGLTGTKKGCNQGACGACTVLVDGERINSCLTFAVQYENREIQTIEGLARDGVLHPIQDAFIAHDGFQCGYCTPGQVCSAVALLAEMKRGDASHITPDVRRTDIEMTDDEVRERMSGNICRCGAYPQIVAAIQEVHTGRKKEQPHEGVLHGKGEDHETI
jgi:xanthine dehydrogenase YagT iron-sulfur-binding subunit